MSGERPARDEERPADEELLEDEEAHRAALARLRELHPDLAELMERHRRPPPAPPPAAPPPAGD